MKATPKPQKYSADVIVVGSGAGGSIAAQILAQAGKRVLIVEESKLGGDCANYSCVPTKALLDTVIATRTLERAVLYGVSTGKIRIDYDTVVHRAHKAIHATGVATNDTRVYSDKNIRVINGRAHFIDSYTISVGLTRYTAPVFIIASGSSPKIPLIEGLPDYPYTTYRTFLSQKKLPKSVAIIGGGSTGYEYSQIYTALGVKTHLFESHYHLFSDNDSEVGDIAESTLRDVGVRIHTSAKVVSVQQAKKATVITFAHNSQLHHVSVDGIFIASGNSANIDIGLHNARVIYNDDGIRTNMRMQTSQKHIYAIGDVAMQGGNASSAIRQGQIAAHNILHRKKQLFDSRAIPYVAYGLPEIVSVGKTERSMQLTGLPYQTAIAPLGIVSRSFSSVFDSGFVKIVATHSGIIVGASIAAPHASELAAELTFAIQHRRRACDIANTVHPFSSWSEAVRVAASKIYCI